MRDVLKRFKVTFKNGYTYETYAYSMELYDGKLYECKPAGFGNDMGIPKVAKASAVLKVEEVTLWHWEII